jgi:outer membrane protein assembly factor BamB
MRERVTIILASLLAMLSLVACDGINPQRLAFEPEQPTQTPRAPFVTPTPRIDPPPTPHPVSVVPPEVEQFAHEWPMANRDYENTRMTTDSPINAGNVYEMGLAWSARLVISASDWGTAASNPLIAGGIVYFQDLMSNVTAFDLETGEVLWTTVYNRAALGPNGPALGYGKIFIQDGINHFIALDAETGEELWETELESSTGTQQPYVYNGYVYTGTGSGIPPQGPDDIGGRDSYTGGISGFVYALDQETGAPLWSFETTEEGYWGNPELNGGGALWYPPGIDTETGITYWGTGNPFPFPGTIDYPNASSRPGLNRWSNAMLALEGRSGELLWYHLAKPGDLFDLDYQSSPVLATNSEGRPMIIGSGKLGRVIGYDRATGEVLWNTLVGEHQNDELEAIPLGEVVEVMPGVWGGVETPKALVDGRVYALVVNVATPWTATGWDSESSGTSVVRAEARTRIEEGTAELLALDVDTGEIIWGVDFDTLAFSGVTIVNDLVFVATYDGVIYAITHEDGEIVWTYQAPGGIIAWPAVAGEFIVWPVGLGREPQLIALRLGATGDIAPPAGQAIPTPEGLVTPIPSPTPIPGGG